MIRIGAFTLHLFNDAATWVDPGGMFGLVPRALWSRYLSANDDQLVPSANHNLLIQAPGKTILVDTGFGNCLSEKRRQRYQLKHFDGTHSGLERLGIAPEAIDIVINTHLHDDHCSGNFRLDVESQRQPAFPNAEYLVNRREYADATKPNERTRATYNPANYRPLVEAGQMRLLDGDCDIVPGISAHITPGHTPGHMSVRISSGRDHAAFLCDMASLAVHFERLAWMTAFDVEPLITLETKRAWQKWALEHDALLIFPHDIQRPAGRLRPADKGRFALEPMAI